MATAKGRFSAEDLARIKSAIQQAEQQSPLEIVPVFLNRSHHYEWIMWRLWGIGMAVFFPVVWAFWTFLEWIYGFPFWMWLLTWVALACLPVICFRLVPGFRRWVIGKKVLYEKTYDKATTAFYELGVHHLSSRTGILILISFFEHRVHLLPDIGAEAAIPGEEVEKVIEQLLHRLRKKETVDGLIEAIAHLGELARDFDPEEWLESAEMEEELDDDLNTEV